MADPEERRDAPDWQRLADFLHIQNANAAEIIKIILEKMAITDAFKLSSLAS